MHETTKKRVESTSRREFIILAAAGATGLAAEWPENLVFARSEGTTTANTISGGVSPDNFKVARQRAVELVSKLTLTEKISQFGAASPAVPRVGIPEFSSRGKKRCTASRSTGPSRPLLCLSRWAAPGIRS